MDDRRSSMKIHRVVQMLGATTSTGKLADDMYDLGHKDYYSEAQDRYVPISHMDFQHMVRAFVKLTEQEGEVKELKQSLDSSHRAYKMGFERNNRHIEETKSWKEKYEQEVKYKEFWKKAYYDETNKLGKGYVFSEIPNDTDGQEFVDTMKKYFNKTSYKMRVRGQHIKPELKGTGATYWGQNLNESTHMRIYIEAKKGE
jgi:hypothetical protein